MALRIGPGDFNDRRIIDLLTHHHATCHAVTPKGSAHALELSGLQAPGIHFWAAWDGGQLLGVGALKELTGRDGEVKSMHTAEAARRSGVATAMLNHIMAEARALGLRRLYLETGSFAFFAPAVALYRSHGFTDCPPFADYKPDPNSVFLARAL